MQNLTQAGIAPQEAIHFHQHWCDTHQAFYDCRCAVETYRSFQLGTLMGFPLHKTCAECKGIVEREAPSVSIGDVLKIEAEREGQ
jgi:hypothetical protein